ncbi:MAG: hypothetical protein IPF78_14855 [Flavobacteriales bacterium]|nr:hypothetical protein [Flavobacteriales bacterium]
MIAITWFGYANRKNTALKGGDTLALRCDAGAVHLGVLTLVTQVWLPWASCTNWARCCYLPLC